MTLNDRALQLADRLAADAATLRISASQTPGGARILDCGVQAEGGLAAGLGMARVCLADLADVTLLPPGSPISPVRWCKSSPIGPSSLAWRRSTPAGRFRPASSSQWVPVPCAAAYGKEELFDHIPGRERPTVRRRRPGDAQAADAGSRGPSGREAPAVARPADAAGRPDREHRRNRAGGRSRPGDGAAQAVRAEIRPDAGGFGRRRRRRCRRWQPTTFPPSAAPTTPSFTAAASPSGCGPTTTSSPPSARACRRRRRATTAPRSRRFSSAITAISTRSIRCCSAPPRSSFHNLRTGRSHAFGRLEPDVLHKSFFG